MIEEIKNYLIEYLEGTMENLSAQEAGKIVRLIAYIKINIK